jgi:hypothetical protein
LSKDGKFYYLYDFTAESLAKWDLYKGEIVEWMSWGSFIQTDDYTPIPEEDGMSFYGPGTVTGLFLAFHHKSQKVSVYNSRLESHVAQVGKTGGISINSEFCVNNEGTFLAFVNKSLDEVSVFDMRSNQVVHTLPYNIGDKHIYFTLAGPWLIWGHKTGEGLIDYHTTYYNLETTEQKEPEEVKHLNPAQHMYYWLASSNSFMVRWRYGSPEKLFTIIDVDSWESEDLELESLIILKNNNYEHWYVSSEGRIVFYHNLSKSFSYSMDEYMGVLALYDPVRDFLFSEEVLNKEKTIDRLYELMGMTKVANKVLAEYYAENPGNEGGTKVKMGWSEGEGSQWCVAYLVDTKTNNISITPALGCDSPPPVTNYSMQCFGTKEEALNFYDQLYDQYHTKQRLKYHPQQWTYVD